MHILFLTDNFPPEGNAPATRTIEHASRWVESGHQVKVITGVPNFPKGKVFEGFKNRWYQTEDLLGIKVIRVITYITANEGFAKRILDYLSFMVSGLFAGLFVKKLDVIVATSPQFFTAVAGWALAGLRRKPFVFELRDIWPESITAVGAMRKSMFISALEKLEPFLYRLATRIFSVTRSFKDELIQRSVSGEKIDIVLNGVDLTKYAKQTHKDEDLAESYELNGKFVAGYVGTHVMAHGLEHIVRAASLIQDQEDIHIVFAGGWAARKKLEKQVNQMGLKNFVLITRVAKEEMSRVWSLCDVSLVNLRNADLFKTVIPSKIFESMGMGIPMVVSMPHGEATEIVSKAEAGLIINPETPDELAQAIIKLRDDKNCWVTCQRVHYQQRKNLVEKSSQPRRCILLHWPFKSTVREKTNEF